MGTARQQIVAQLEDADMTARDLSQALGISEKEVIRHLAHIEKSLAAQGRRLTISPSLCLACGFRFIRRRRFTRPGRCPQCRRTRITDPAFTVDG